MLSCSVGYGQIEWDSIAYNKDTTGYDLFLRGKLFKTVGYIYGSRHFVCTLQDSVNTLPTDTIPVLMLMCDTGYKKNASCEISVYDSDTGKEVLAYSENRTLFTWWNFGYQVIEKDPQAAEAGYYTISTHVNYLDSDKKPLFKSIIVWQSKKNKMKKYTIILLLSCMFVGCKEKKGELKKLIGTTPYTTIWTSDTTKYIDLSKPYTITITDTFQLKPHYDSLGNIIINK